MRYSIDVFSQYPVYRYAKRPNELNEYLYTIDKMDIQPGERKKVLLILSVTASFLNEIEEEGIVFFIIYIFINRKSLLQKNLDFIQNFMNL